MHLPSPSDIRGLAADLWADATTAAGNIVAWVAAHPQLFTLVTLLAVIPAIFWLWLFIRKDAMDRVHRRFMVLTFVLGTLSVLPVFAADEVFATLFGIDMRTIFLGVGVRGAGESFNFVLSRFLYFLVCVGMLEEYAKHVVVKEVDYRRRFFTRIVDGIEFSVAAALGFAFIENILYFLQAWNFVGQPKGAWTFVGVVLMRSVGSMLAHVLFSGIFGYYYGRAKFLDDTVRKDRRAHFHLHIAAGLRVRWLRIKHWWEGSHVLLEIGHRVHRDELIAEGLLIAMTLHGLYNTALDFNRVYLIVPLLFLEFLFVWHELEVTENRIVHAAPERSRGLPSRC